MRGTLQACRSDPVLQRAWRETATIESTGAAVAPILARGRWHRVSAVGARPAEALHQIGMFTSCACGGGSREIPDLGRFTDGTHRTGGDREGDPSGAELGKRLRADRSVHGRHRLHRRSVGARFGATLKART